MNTEIFKRNIKLQELGIGELSIREQEILDFLNEKVNYLNSYSSDKHTDFLFFGKSKDNIILQYIEQGRYIYVGGVIWSFFELKLNMEYIDIQELMGWWVGNLLNITHHFESFAPVKEFLIPPYHFKKNTTNKLIYEYRNI